VKEKIFWVYMESEHETESVAHADSAGCAAHRLPDGQKRQSASTPFERENSKPHKTFLVHD
jgi:hypothetical protein